MCVANARITCAIPGREAAVLHRLILRRVAADLSVHLCVAPNFCPNGSEVGLASGRYLVASPEP
jgi:hypothetical protein